MGRSLGLRFSAEVPAAVRGRISYAFRVFAAIYGHRVVEDGLARPDVYLHYGKDGDNWGDTQNLHVPALCAARPTNAPTPRLTKHLHAGHIFHLFHGVDARSGHPDWLGEIFEWLSNSDERGITARDSVGRIPYRETLFAKQGISPIRPHAALMMAWLEGRLADGPRSENLPKAPSPISDASHVVICSQDIDYYFTGRRAAAVRLMKNQAIALLLARNLSFFASSSAQLLQLLIGRRVGDFLPALMEAAARDNFRSSLFVIARSRHRRDSNYALSHILPLLREASQGGFSVGLHGSYQSIVKDSDLPSEAALLEKVTDVRPQGGRQHWLRFDSHEKLFRNVEESGLLFDTSLGFSETVGFRSGASFAFPPYNFEKEEPYRFLEIPLVVMDTALWQASRTVAKSPAHLAEQVLNESRRWGWGGISVLWHNPIEPLCVPKEVNRIFWTQLRKRSEYREQWTSAEEFLRRTISRYQDARLLKGVRLDVELAAD